MWTFVYTFSAHVPCVCVYTHVTTSGISARTLSSCVPNWLWHICGFSRQIRASAKLPRNQCNRLCPSTHSQPHHPSPTRIPRPLSSMPPLPTPPFLCLSPSPLSSFFFPLSCSEPLLKMEWVCAAYLKWSWMDLNGWWYLVSPQGAAMSP